MDCHPVLKSPMKEEVEVHLRSRNMLLCILQLLYGSVGQHKGVLAVINSLSCAWTQGKLFILICTHLWTLNRSKCFHRLYSSNRPQSKSLNKNKIISTDKWDCSIAAITASGRQRKWNAELKWACWLSCILNR